MKKPQFVAYTADEIQKRYEAWAKLPASEPAHFRTRHEAWSAYCDARDGLPDGFNAGRTEARQTNQMDLFARRVMQ